MFEEIFMNSCPKFLTPDVPDYEGLPENVGKVSILVCVYTGLCRESFCCLKPQQLRGTYVRMYLLPFSLTPLTTHLIAPPTSPSFTLHPSPPTLPLPPLTPPLLPSHPTPPPLTRYIPLTGYDSPAMCCLHDGH